MSKSAAAILAITLFAAAVQAQTDPVSRAKELRYQGRLDEAERLLRPLAGPGSTSYLALYNMGLIEEARAQKLAGPARAAKLREAAGWLERTRALQPRQKPAEYTIFNTLGYVYLQLKDIVRAEAVLAQGLRFEGSLSNISRAKLHNNLGYLYALKGERVLSAKHYQTAASLRAGSVSVSAASNAQRVKSVK